MDVIGPPPWCAAFIWLIKAAIHYGWSPIDHFIGNTVLLQILMFFFVIFRVAVVAIVLVVIVLTAVVIGARVNQYRGIVGLVFFIVLLFITSDNPSKVGSPNPHLSCQLVVTLNMYM